MDNDLSRLLNERKREACPSRVLARLEDETRVTPKLTLGLWLAASTALLLTIAVVSRPDLNREHEQLEAKLRERAAQERVIQTTYASLAYIGNVILKTTEKTQQILLPESLIPSRDGINETRTTNLEENETQN